MSKMSDYILLKEEAKAEVEIEYLEKIIAKNEKIRSMSQDMQEVLNEIQMGVSQIENLFAPITDTLENKRTLSAMFKDLNDWIEKGLKDTKVE